MPTAKRKSKPSARRAAPARTAKRKGARRAPAAKVPWLAKGYPLMSPVAVTENCADAIDWYRKVLGAKLRMRLDMPGGMVAHCELGFGDAVLMMGSPMPPEFPPNHARLGLYVKNCDAVYKKAVEAGARSLQEPTDQFYGDRNARFVDPFGNEWSVMTHVREVSVREMKKAMAQMGATEG